MSATMEQLRWLGGNDVGVSSATIWRVMTGEAPGRMRDHTGRPYDDDDLGRCIRLLDLFPEWRGRLPEVAARYPEWDRLLPEWLALEKMLREEMVRTPGIAPETYKRMCELEGR